MLNSVSGACLWPVLLAADQQCKFFKGFVNPLGDLGYDEGALCTPQVGGIHVQLQSREPLAGACLVFGQQTGLLSNLKEAQWACKVLLQALSPKDCAQSGSAACGCLQVYLINVTFNILECNAELTPGPNPNQALLPVWCAPLVGLPGST